MFHDHGSIYVSIIHISTKVIIRCHKYKFIARVRFTSILLKFYYCFRKNNYQLGILAAVYARTFTSNSY